MRCLSTTNVRKHATQHTTFADCALDGGLRQDLPFTWREAALKAAAQTILPLPPDFGWLSAPRFPYL